jgi:hypothetical protein
LLVDGNGNNETNACMLVAQQQRVSEAKVRRAWKRFGMVVRLGDLEQQRYPMELLDRQYADLGQLRYDDVPASETH